MSRTYYTDYVRHILRFYSRYSATTPPFKSEVDKQNWWSCHRAIESYSHATKQMLLSVYSGHDTLPDEVYIASQKWKVDQNWIWDTMKEFERKVARKRGLL